MQKDSVADARSAFQSCIQTQGWVDLYDEYLPLNLGVND